MAREDPYSTPFRYETGDRFRTSLETWKWEVCKRLTAEDGEPYYYLDGVGDDNLGKSKLIAEESLNAHFEHMAVVTDGGVDRSESEIQRRKDHVN
ncbi:hypothetical protein Hbl1158_17120 (plasmid) [Halobaculum sp. CBA1158]|uniref:hypothetical protein n=1 Tax=Halobaculum sp. CBA1158 TaxID=2904243 RepID=UPI001F3BB61E|nr:hypothetical protein [Halobaculum sp. CBA1158]UIP01724.1 hypothetical protein Hbl1158_17120 [Halobaculum sp. CBA1158]